MIREAANAIKDGKLVAFPTETVYGLGADATNEHACKKIFALKERPSFNPLIVHVANIDDAMALGYFDDDAMKLANALWPGPLSMVVKAKENNNIAHVVMAGLGTIAIRIPAHEIALELIKEAGVPIAAPSANKSGQISSTEASHVQKYFANYDVMILEDFDLKTKIGLESTIIDATSLTILRDGFISIETLSSILNKNIAMSNSLMQIKAPGMMEKHYAPKTQLRINANSSSSNEVCLNFGASNLDGSFNLNLSETGDLIEAARNFYAMLHILDDYAISRNINIISVAQIPFINIGIAINDKLKRASTY